MTDKKMIAKGSHRLGISPAIALVNPKFPHNVGATVRAASCFGVGQVWFSGKRVSLDPKGPDRLPREERMKGYNEVDLINGDYFFDAFPKDTVPVAIEVRQNSELLPTFVHPENALYVFGPEDGSIPSSYLRHCHRFVIVPTRHCVNLSAAVYMVLYDRMVKRQALGLEDIAPADKVLAESRGFFDGDRVNLDGLE